MATINIEATRSEGLGEFRFKLDDHEYNIDMTPSADDQNVYEGTDDADGVCGDGSAHILYFNLVGTVGSTLRLKIFCEGNPRKNVLLEIFGPAVVEPGNVDFTL